MKIIDIGSPIPLKSYTQKMKCCNRAVLVVYRRKSVFNVYFLSQKRNNIEHFSVGLFVQTYIPR